MNKFNKYTSIFKKIKLHHLWWQCSPSKVTAYLTKTTLSGMGNLFSCWSEESKQFPKQQQNMKSRHCTVEDTIHSRHRTWKTWVVTDLEISSLTTDKLSQHWKELCELSMEKSNQQSYPVITPRNHNSKQNAKRFWKVQGRQIYPEGKQQSSSWTKGPLNRREIMVNTVSPCAWQSQGP